MQLEQTILDVTAQHLRELKYAADKKEPGDLADCMRDFFTLAGLARIQNSGLSSDAVQAMVDMENEALDAMGQALEAMRSPES